MPEIHPTSVVETGAQIADDVIVGPLCYIGEHVSIGAGSILISQATVIGNTTLGRGNTVFPHATLGAFPQDLKYKGENSRLVIGDNNDFRESVTAHLGTENGGGVTTIGSDSLFMVGAHVAHDCDIGNHVILANSVLLAGHVQIQDHAVVSGDAALHHFVTVGEYAYVGGKTRIVHDVPPFMIVEGNPSRVRGFNKIGLERHGFDPDSIQHIRDAYRRLFGGNENGNSPANTNEALASLEKEYPDDGRIEQLIGFVRCMAEGTSGRHRESKRSDDRHSNTPK